MAPSLWVYDLVEEVVAGEIGQVCRQASVIAELDEIARVAPERVMLKGREMLIGGVRREVGERESISGMVDATAGLKHEVIAGRSSDRHGG